MDHFWQKMGTNFNFSYCTFPLSSESSSYPPGYPMTKEHTFLFLALIFSVNQANSQALILQASQLLGDFCLLLSRSPHVFHVVDTIRPTCISFPDLCSPFQNPYCRHYLCSFKLAKLLTSWRPTLSVFSSQLPASSSDACKGNRAFNRWAIFPADILCFIFIL